MKIYYDEFMPFGKEFFSSLGDAIAFQGRSLTAEQITDANALAVRTTTKCNESLLAGCEQLSFVGTATAGYNHFDTEYLDRRNINWSNAAGCNAHSVADWFLTVILSLAAQDNIVLKGKSLGVIGVGNVGSLVVSRGKALGMKVVCYDPPRADKEKSDEFVSLDDILSCDFISMHAPFNKAGKYQNKHLIDQNSLEKLSEQQYLINGGRGELIDNQALLAFFEAGKKLQVVLDVWENEPDVLWSLVPYLRFATQHIAGHSLEGKARGTEMVYNQLCRHMGVEPTIKLIDLLPTRECSELQASALAGDQQELTSAVQKIYDIATDDQLFRSKIKSAAEFDYYRKAYPIRREVF